MFGSKVISNNFSKIKNKITSYYHTIINIPNWCNNRVLQLKNYYNDCKYKFTHLKETNYTLALEHLYKGNLGDALLRFNMVDKFFTSKIPAKNLEIDYWLGWTYFLKNNYAKALEYIEKSSAKDKVQMVTFLQNYQNIQEVPKEIWQRYRDLTAQYYTNIFQNNNNIHLPYSFINQTLQQITDLPDNYSILELGSNVGLAGYEIQKRFPESFTLTGIESSALMNDLLNSYYSSTKIYDQVYNTSISEFLKQTSSKFDVIISFCGLSFTSKLEKYFTIIHQVLNQNGYFAFCLPVASNTKFLPKRKEFIFNLNQIRETLNKANFDTLSVEELVLTENNKYCIVICKKTSTKK